jgi:hypothetical protein
MIICRLLASGALEFFAGKGRWSTDYRAGFRWTDLELARQYATALDAILVE